jgi:hypothetical protein
MYDEVDDKRLIILSIVLLTLASMFAFGAEAITITTAAVSGLFGVYVGKKL